MRAKLDRALLDSKLNTCAEYAKGIDSLFESNMYYNAVPIKIRDYVSAFGVLQLQILGYINTSMDNIFRIYDMNILKVYVQDIHGTRYFVSLLSDMYNHRSEIGVITSSGLSSDWVRLKNYMNHELNYYSRKFLPYVNNVIKENY